MTNGIYQHSENINIFRAIERAWQRKLNVAANTARNVLLGQLAVDHIRTILLKPVGDYCNLRCTYCYEGENLRHQNTMSLESLEKLFENLARRPGKRIAFAWHGGEPLLAGMDFYRTALELQSRILIGKEIGNVIQTNGFILNKEWAQFLASKQVRIGLSLDGHRETNDSSRRTASGKGTFDRVTKSIQLLNDMEIPFGVITVVGDETPRDLIDLCIEYKISNIDVHPQNSSGLADGSQVFNTGPDALEKYLIALFDLWSSIRDDIKIDVFEQFFTHFIGARSEKCYFNGGCSNIIAIDNKDNISPCTRPFATPFKNFGNLTDYRFDLDRLEDSEIFKAFSSRDIASQENLKECKWFGLCHNGCPQHRVKNGTQDIASGDLYCNCSNNNSGGYYNVWEHCEAVTESVFRSAGISLTSPSAPSRSDRQ